MGDNHQAQKPSTTMLTNASAQARAATSADELRRALAITLPEQFKLTLAETASVLGRSVSWVAKERAIAAQAAPRVKREHGGRRNELVAQKDEDAFMAAAVRSYAMAHTKWRQSLIGSARYGASWTLSFVDHVKARLEKRVGRSISRSTAYNLMKRVGSRRFPMYEAEHWTIHCRAKFFR